MTTIPGARRYLRVATLLALLGIAPAIASANGVSDDRVSLPDGPGSISGIGENLQVDSNMGQMRYSVPIELPDGHASATPSFALQYSSGQGSTVLGVGWDMPVPYIERSSVRGLPQYTEGDLFFADGGTELVAIGGGVYRARFERAFNRYTWKDVGTAGYWTVEAPDGTVDYYGARADGTLVPSARIEQDGLTFRYQLVESVDVFGHRVVYEYDKLGGMTPLLSRVNYLYTGDKPRYTVEFEYDTRNDVLSDCAATYEVLLGHRLQQVNIFSAGSPLASYKLDYEGYDSSGGLSRLTRVTRFAADGAVYPAVKTFGYSTSIGSHCSDCTGAYMVNMGKPAIGAAMTSGRATMVDINADGLPDLALSAGDGSHTFFVNQLGDDMQPAFPATGTPSAVATAQDPWDIGLPSVQAFDVNGDGLTDLYDRINGKALCNNGSGDWVHGDCLPTGGSGDNSFTDDADDNDGADDPDPSNVRFLDYDNDKRVDWIRTDSDASTVVFENTPSGFSSKTIDPIGFQFDAGTSGVTPSLADMNGDGLQDPARIVVSSDTAVSVEYRLNLGYGRWSATTTVPFTGSGLLNAQVSLEDLNGDGADDLVVVASDAVRFAINRNGTSFDDFVTIGRDNSADLTVADLPSVTADQTVVLFADMNGTGTTDIVWIQNDGQIDFLELFRVRPNLLDRIENGLGAVQTVTYTTSAEERKRAELSGTPWTRSLTQPMNVVSRTDLWTSLTGGEDGEGLHEVETFAYRDGHYDGLNKAFRGFGDVTRTLVGSDSQEAGEQRLTYDLAVEDPYRNGLLLVAESYGGEGKDRRLLDRVETSYDDCPVDGVPNSTALPVRHVCQVAQETVIAEGTEQAQHVTTRTETVHDGYGHVIVERELGIVGQDGDELTTETDYILPGASKAHPWLHGLATRETRYGADSALRSITVNHYDGEAFVGLDEGEVDKGLPTRVQRFVSATESIDTERSKFDAHGNAIETLDPNGDPDELNAHRRVYTYDGEGLQVVRVEVKLEDADGEPYSLVREMSYHPQYNRPTLASGWMVEQGGEFLTPRNQTRYTYDKFMRIETIIMPGDSEGAPSQVISYELGDPVTRVTTRRRSHAGESADLARIECRDGRGRLFQTRQAIGDGNYLVDGFLEFNNRGSVVRSFQAFVSASEDCDMSPPDEVLFTSHRYDAKGREILMTEPDADQYGSASIARTEYRPLTTLTYDSEDSDEDSPHFNTPTVRRTDGLGRLVEVARYLKDQDAAEPAKLSIEYDGLGRMTAYVDALGNRKEAEYDLLDRALRVNDPNMGEIHYAYDPAGNLIARTDARGIRVERTYDGMNRLTAQISGDDAQDRITLSYDFAPKGCDDCSQPAGQLVRRMFPLADGSHAYRDSGYDARGNTVYDNLHVLGQDLSTRYSLDNVDRVTTTEYADGQVIARAYDGAGRMVGVPTVGVSVGYDARGMVSGVEYGNGVQAQLRYDPRQRLVAATVTDAEGEDLLAFTYDHDREGNLLQIDDRGAHPLLQTFTYDAYYRVTDADFDTGAVAEGLAYEYDLIDRVLSRKSDLGADSPAHLDKLAYKGKAPQAVTSAGGIEREYDAAGQMVRRGQTELDWDYRGLLVGIAGETGEHSLSYDDNAVRVVDTHDDGASVYVNSEFEIHDGISFTYVRGGEDRFARLESDALATAFFPDADDDGHIGAYDAYLTAASEGDARRDMLRSAARRLLMEAEDGPVYLHQDHIHSVVAATDADGKAIATRSYYPNGLLRGQTGFVDRYGFTGQAEVEGTGLLQFRGRLFELQTGRWISVDPMFESLGDKAIESLGDGTSGYAYLANRGVNTSDPTGFGPGDGGGRRRSTGSGSAKRSSSSRGRSGSTPAHVGIPTSKSQPKAAPQPKAAAKQHPGMNALLSGLKGGSPTSAFSSGSSKPSSNKASPSSSAQYQRPAPPTLDKATGQYKRADGTSAGFQEQAASPRPLEFNETKQAWERPANRIYAKVTTQANFKTGLPKENHTKAIATSLVLGGLAIIGTIGFFTGELAGGYDTIDGL